MWKLLWGVGNLPFGYLRYLPLCNLLKTYWWYPPAIQAARLRHIVREVANRRNTAPCFCCVHPLGLRSESSRLLTLSHCKIFSVKLKDAAQKFCTGCAVKDNSFEFCPWWLLISAGKCLLKLTCRNDIYQHIKHGFSLHNITSWVPFLLPFFCFFEVLLLLLLFFALFTDLKILATQKSKTARNGKKWHT